MILIRSRFYFGSAAAFVAVAVGLVLSYRQLAIDDIVRFQETQHVVLARVLANVLWPGFAGHVESATPARLEDLRANAVTLELNQEIAKVVRNTPIHRVKIYNLAGLTVFSSNLGQIGESRADNPGFRAAADRRRPSSVMSFRESFTGFAKTYSSVYLVETYIPIEREDGKIEGIFELYTEASAAVRRVGDSVIRFGAIAAAGLGLLYAGLGFAVRRAR